MYNTEYMYSEYSLIHHNLFSKNMWINEFCGSTGYSVVLVHYIGTRKLWHIKRFDG